MNETNIANLFTEATKQEVARRKAEKEQHINRIWAAMVKGFQEVDPTLAAKWGARKPAGYVGKTGNPGLSMYCGNLKLSVLVEFNPATDLYLLGNNKDGCDEIEALTTVLTPEEIAPAIIEYLNKTT